MQMAPFQEAVSEHLWHSQYQWSSQGHPQEPSIDASWDRVALAVSAAEAHERHAWRQRFRAILDNFKFLPGGRILAAAGTPLRCSLFDCFAAGVVEDSITGIFNALRESMLTLQGGSACGIDFSTLRPAGSLAISSGGVATGPVSFMQLWDQAAAVLETDNRHPSNLMATLRCDHPDVEAFINAKMDATALKHFKLSLLVGDDFLQALEHDGSWPLVFALGEHSIPVGAEVCTRLLPGNSIPEPCLVHRRIPARALWDKLLHAQKACGEPQVLFIDRINKANNLWYCQQPSTASPCGAIPLEPHGCCSHGAINLTRFVQHAFSDHPSVDFAGLRAVAAVATRFLDNVYDISLFPLKAQEKAAHASRSVGLGVTGLADMFVMLGVRYGSPSSVELTRSVMDCIRDTAYRASIEIAQEKGAFPAFDKVRYGAGGFILDLARDIQLGISQYGIRNSHLLAVCPSESTSLLANNISGGVAPIAALQSQRTVCGYDGQSVEFRVQDHAWHQFLTAKGPQASPPAHCVQAAQVTAEEQLKVMAAVQACVDQAICASVQLPAEATLQALELDVLQAQELGLKGFAAHCQSSLES